MAELEERTADITTTTTATTIDDGELELSLGLRPFQKQLPPPQNAAFCQGLMSKRGVQALRRMEAKQKRDLRRKGRKNNEGEGERGCNKVVRLVAPPWWGWNAPPCGGGYQGQNGHNNNIVPVLWQNGACKDGENRQSICSGSSSGISDNYETTSGPGGNNGSDAGSHSNQSHSQLPPLIVQPSNGSPLHNPSSSQTESKPSSSTSNHFQSQLSSSSIQTEPVSNSSQPSESPESVTTSEIVPHSSKCLPEVVPSSSTKGQTSSTRSLYPKQGKGDIGKPPKPNVQIKQQKPVSSQMPCVSATGNGPNGKTVTGFLYRYTKSEVSIACVCHGTSFTPASFVEHAGGVGVEHPLRHIRVVPFALGLPTTTSTLPQHF